MINPALQTTLTALIMLISSSLRHCIVMTTMTPSINNNKKYTIKDRLSKLNKIALTAIRKNKFDKSAANLVDLVACRVTFS